MRKYRVVEKIVKNNSKFFPQVLDKILYIFPVWRRISSVTIDNGDISLMDNFDHGYDTIKRAWERTREYEESLKNQKVIIHY